MRSVRLAAVSAAAVGVCAYVAPAMATPGTHPALLSTADTRSSSVVLTYRQGLGPLAPRMISYNANFTATSGNFSAQFGAHVLQLRETHEGNTLYGAAATGAAVMSIPVASRFNTGLPRAALLVYAGGAPTAAISGERNFLNVPIGIGVGLPLSPAPWITISPWFEAAPGVDLDTTIHDPDLSEYEPDEADLQQVLNGDDVVLLSEDDIRDVIADSVELDLAFEIPLRAGLDVTARLSESWSVNVNSYVTSLGTAFAGRKFVYLGAGAVFHWDSVVPSILRPEQRLLNESCEDIETRFRMCPASRSSQPATISPEPPAVPLTESAPWNDGQKMNTASDAAQAPAAAVTAAPTTAKPDAPSMPARVAPPKTATDDELPSGTAPVDVPSSATSQPNTLPPPPPAAAPTPSNPGEPEQLPSTHSPY